MSTIAKIVLIILAIAVIGAGVAFGFSRYLVSKLDGTGGITPVEQPTVTMLQYASEDGYSFEYPDTYELSSRTDGDHDVLVLLPVGYVAPEGGEGPPAIAVQVLHDVDATTIEDWVRTDTRSNFQLSTAQGFATSTIGGIEGVAYTHSGLYETDAAAVLKDGSVYFFSAGWLTPGDQIRQDFMRLLSSVQFN